MTRICNFCTFAASLDTLHCIDFGQSSDPKIEHNSNKCFQSIFPTYGWILTQTVGTFFCNKSVQSLQRIQRICNVFNVFATYSTDRTKVRRRDIGSSGCSILFAQPNVTRIQLSSVSKY